MRSESLSKKISLLPDNVKYLSREMQKTRLPKQSGFKSLRFSHIYYAPAS